MQRRGEERWRDRQTQTTEYFHILKAARLMEGAETSIQMLMGVHLFNLCKHEKAKKHALKGKQQSECIHFSVVCQLLNADLYAFFILRFKRACLNL